MLSTTRQRIVRAVAVSTAAAALTAFYLWVVNTTGMMPRCLFKLVTGWSCPGCGSQRAFHALLRGDFHAALEANLLLPFAMAYLVVLGAAYLFSANRKIKNLYTHSTSPIALIIIAIVITAWAIVRNILGI